jgi:hypothetical protein
MSSSEAAPAVHNVKAVLSVLVGLLALGVVVAGAGSARFVDEVGLREAAGAVGLGFLLALAAISLARRGRFDYQLTLGRVGGAGAARFGRVLGTIALLVSLTAALAIGVYLVLTIVLD